ncbi:hypothetical protein BU25DRAFT_489213 [Macroventuria anomochaeta]|uniref:Uncharacterized protein n=1 Tax=Macroventuria anomochaeta TaxID=301207 RepID=A0ACB6S856_9PLEO|nr:uncharacterized protein BU25DRAFT_489213 [Macroventuria anomochaeta]KAF2630450.1 hypothetical protein BU25DRAFT_489213 [Macroventuria anomochaeta]
MSKRWTPELDSILLHGVFEECQISFGKALCEKIAGRVRATGIEGFAECTPKAVENRLYSWKKKNVSTSTSNGETPASTPKKAATKPKKEPGTLKSPRAKKGSGKEKADEEEAGDEELKSPSQGRKRANESEERGEEKKVKIEPSDVKEEDV